MTNEVVFMRLLDQLKQQRDFTNNEQRIAAYILANLPAMTTIYLKDLAAATYTSHSAIIRLAQKLGFRGFREFQTALTTAAANEAHALDTVDANFPVAPNDDAQMIAKKMAALTVNTINATYQQLDTALLQQVAQTLRGAQRLFLFAQGDSQMRARSFQNKLVKLNQFAIIAEEYGDEAWNAANLTPNDVAIFISYAGTTRTHQQFVTYLQQQKVSIVVLTGNPDSPLLSAATYPIVTVQSEYNFAKIGTFASQAAFEYVLDTLFSLMYAQDLPTNLRSLQQKQQLMQAGPLTTK